MGKLRKNSFAKQRVKYGWAYQDTWNIDMWFMNTMKPMLVYFRDSHHGHPFNLKDDSEWVDILNEMISLLEKMNESDPNTLKNKYEKEYDAAWEDFDIKCHKGIYKIGERTSEGTYVLKTMSSIDEYKDVCKRYFRECERLSKERDECKNKFFELFSKYFWDLWD